MTFFHVPAILVVCIAILFAQRPPPIQAAPPTTSTTRLRVGNTNHHHQHHLHHDDDPAARRHLQQDTTTTANTNNPAATYDYFDNIDLNEVALCGCASCFDRGDSGYTTRTGDLTCSQRIMGLMIANTVTGGGLSEEAACTQIAQQDFADECGPLCDADICDGRLPPPKDSSLSSLSPPVKTFCGCQTCTTDVWLSMAGDFSCGARVAYLSDFRGQTHVDACRRVAGVEFAAICGPCNPDTCPPADPSSSSLSAEDPDATTTFTALENSNHPFNNNAASQQQQQQHSNVNHIPLTPDFPLYCYPEYPQRMRYENVWGKYQLEVKESGLTNKCGPSDNLFSRDTVQVQDNGKALTLQFKQVNQQWHGSEVRVLLPPEEMPYHYGTYSFSVKSIQVIDTTTGTVVDTTLPVTIILGLFTWDATEDYATHENYNHEVDVEIARWNIEDLSDVQYLVQPPGDPHKYRFFSGPPGGNTAYHQAPHEYKFDWRPAEIEWNSDAGGGGHTFVYSTQMALDAGQPDYTQCLPADVEVRMNLWNLFGDSIPEGMQDTYMVEVVIDDFHFTPNGLTALPENGVCSKDCHCSESSSCQKNRCTSNSNSNGDNDEAQESSSATTVDLDVNVVNGTPPTAAEQPTTQEESSGPSAAKPYEFTTAEASATAAAGSGKGGLQKAGKSLLSIGFLVAAAVVVLLLVRNRRDTTNRSRMVLFHGGDPNKKVVVECWEEETEQDSSVEPSFEMSLKNIVKKQSSSVRLFAAG